MSRHQGRRWPRTGAGGGAGVATPLRAVVARPRSLHTRSGDLSFLVGCLRIRPCPLPYLR
jgi:hypothetical protein